MIFNTYNEEKKCIQIFTETPQICLIYVRNGNKKCDNFYNSVINNKDEKGVFTCPYGLCAVKTQNDIYTSLNITEKSDLTKLVPNLSRHKQNLRQYTQYSLSQIIKIIDEYEKINYETQVRRVTIHDIKNAIKHFMDLAEDVKEDEEVKKIASSNEKLFSSVEGYSLIQYRLAYHDKLLNFEDNTISKAYINVHQTMVKLSKLLKYRGIKKGVEIKFHGQWKAKFSVNKDSYLMYFILLENALKFALENTRVDISFGMTEEKELKVEIKNESYPLDEEEIENIFKTGFRSRMAISTSKGSGLGLTLAKKIADASNITLDCKYDPLSAEKGKFIMECIHKREDADK